MVPAMPHSSAASSSLRSIGRRSNARPISRAMSSNASSVMLSKQPSLVGGVAMPLRSAIRMQAPVALGYPPSVIEQNRIVIAEAMDLDPGKPGSHIVRAALHPGRKRNIRRATPGAHAEAHRVWVILLLSEGRDNEVSGGSLAPVSLGHVKRRTEPEVAIGHEQPSGQRRKPRHEFFVRKPNRDMEQRRRPA